LPVIVAALVVVGAQVALTHSVLGRQLLAVGANDEAARLAGIRVDRVRQIAFILCGALAGLAAITQTTRLSAADPNAGLGLELEAIAAVVIGGASLSGGRGSVAASALGAMVMAVLGAGLAQMGVQEPTRRLTTGAVIVVAATVDIWRRR
jgi:ribose transport system permease protein